MKKSEYPHLAPNACIGMHVPTHTHDARCFNFIYIFSNMKTTKFESFYFNLRNF